MSGSLALQPAYCASIYAFLLCHARHRASLSGVLAAVPRDVALLIAQRVRADSLKNARSFTMFYALYAEGDITLSQISETVHHHGILSCSAVTDVDEADDALLQYREEFIIYEPRDMQLVSEHILNKEERLRELFVVECRGGEWGTRNELLPDEFINDGNGHDLHFDEDTIRDLLEDELKLFSNCEHEPAAALSWMRFSGVRRLAKARKLIQ